MVCNLAGISTSLQITEETYFHVLSGSKLTLVLLAADGEASWLPLKTHIYVASECNLVLENSRISININQSYHHLSA